MYYPYSSRSAKFKKLNSVISSFKKLKNVMQQKSGPTPPYKIKSLYSLTEELRTLKKQILPKRENEIKKHIKKLGDKLKLSSFSIMEYDFHENTHSNILEYIFDYKLMGNEAADLFAEFISYLRGNFTDLSLLIKKKNYIVVRECSVKNGRMDLFIHDKKNKFAIVIENKIFADVSEKELQPDDNLIHKTQLNIYINHLNHNYKTYKKLYILLSYKPIESQEEYKPFISVDYNYLYKIFESFERKIKDRIFDDYKILLHSLVNDLYDNKKYLFRQLNSMRNDRKFISPNLNSIEQLRILLNGYK